MIRHKSIVLIAFAGLILALVLGLFCAQVRAEGFSKRTFLPEQELLQHVAVFEKRVQADPEDIEAWKGLGIAFHYKKLAADLATKHSRERKN